MREASPAPLAGRGGLIVVPGAPGKGVLSDQIIDAAKVVTQDQAFFFALRQRARAAFDALARRCSFVSFFARALPPWLATQR